MQENLLFEYAVVRIVPHVEREEFINIGVVLYCSKQKFLESKFHLDEKRISAFCNGIDLQELNSLVDAFVKICKGGKDAGPIGSLPLAERFRWLTAARSTILQTSKVHPGLSTNAQATLEHLHQQLVLPCCGPTAA